MLLLATRNILRNRRRTYITLFLVISGTFLLSSLRFIAFGFTQEMVTRSASLDSGLVEVAAYGWVERPTLYRALETDDALLNQLKLVSSGKISPRLKGGALMSYNEKTRFVSVLAADSEKEAGITTLQETLEVGRLPEFPPRLNADSRIQEAMVGVRLARALDLKPGSRFYLISSQFDGSLGAQELEITGIFRSRNPGLDATRVVTPLETGHRLFGTRTQDKTYYTSIALQTEDFMDAERIRGELDRMFGEIQDPDNLPPGQSSVFSPVALGWRQLNPAVVEMNDMATSKMDIYLIFFVISISFGILNTVQMSIQERMRELGILIAIGTKLRSLYYMLFWEVFLLIVPGVVIGILLAGSLSLYLNFYPLDLHGTTLGNIYISMGFKPVFRPILDVSEFLKIAAWLILPAFSVGFFATGRIRKLNPVEVIQIL